MSDNLAFIIILFSPVIGITSVLIGKSIIKERTNKKLPLYLCDIACVFGIVIFISYIICSRGGHINPQYSYTEYPIEKLTFNTVIFSNGYECNLQEPYVIIEKPNEEYQNVVIYEKEKYIIQWFCKVKMSSIKYHVYLSEDVYDRLQDGHIIYEAK